MSSNNNKLPPLEELQGAKARLLKLVQQLYGQSSEVQFGDSGTGAWVTLPCGRELPVSGYAPRLLAKISWKNRCRLAAHQAFLTLCLEQKLSSDHACAARRAGGPCAHGNEARTASTAVEQVGSDVYPQYAGHGEHDCPGLGPASAAGDKDLEDGELGSMPLPHYAGEHIAGLAEKLDQEAEASAAGAAMSRQESMRLLDHAEAIAAKVLIQVASLAGNPGCEVMWEAAGGSRTVRRLQSFAGKMDTLMGDVVVRVKLKAQLSQIMFLLEGTTWSPMPYSSGCCLLWSELLRIVNTLKADIAAARWRKVVTGLQSVQDWCDCSISASAGMTVPYVTTADFVSLGGLVLGSVYAGLPRVAVLVGPLLGSGVPAKVRSSASHLICRGLNTSPPGRGVARRTPARAIADQLLATLRRQASSSASSRDEAHEAVSQLIELSAALLSAERDGRAVRPEGRSVMQRGGSGTCSCRVCTWGLPLQTQAGSPLYSSEGSLNAEDFSMQMAEAVQGLEGAQPAVGSDLVRSLKEAARAMQPLQRRSR